MPSPRALLTLVLLLPACPERPKGDTETGTEPSTGPTPGTDSESSGASVGSTTPGSTATTSVPPTTTDASTDDSATTVAPSTTTGDGTTDDSATTDDPSDTAASTTIFKIDLPAGKWPAGLVGCTLDAPAGTMLAGASELGAFTANRAYFGWWGFDDQEKPTILFVSPEADPAVEVAEKDGSTGPVYFGDIVTEPLLLGGWVGDWAANLSVRANGMITFPQPQGSVDIVELAGNWDAVDPADPPRLVGTVKGSISGPFNAVFCDKLVENIFPE